MINNLQNGNDYSKIFNDKGIEITDKDIDLNKGYIRSRTVVTKHHETIPAIPAVSHFEPATVYFTDGTSYQCQGIKDPNIELVDTDTGLFNYIGEIADPNIQVKGMDIRTVEDTPAIPEKPAWDETEIVGDYILYTPEELASIEKQKETQNFIETGENRLSNNEQAVNDLTLSMAEMLGV